MMKDEQIEEMEEQKYRSVKIFSSVIINYLIFLKIRKYFKKGIYLYSYPFLISKLIF